MIPYSEIRQQADLLEYREVKYNSTFVCGYEEVYVHKTKPIIFECYFPKDIPYNLPATIKYKYIDD